MDELTMKQTVVMTSLVMLVSCWLSLTDCVQADGIDDFRPTADFLQLPDRWTLGPCSAVAVSRKGEIYVFHRGPHPILCFNQDGKFLRSWGDDLIQIAHGLRIDRDDNVWVTDVGGHRVYRFDPSGKLLLALGTGQPGTANDQFDKPTDIAFGPNDEVYISDGYGNNRVLRFNGQGQLQTSWGMPGNQNGQFHLPHSIVVDREGRVLVGDRENNRIQVFNRDGTWLATSSGFAPYGLALDPEGRLFVADGRANQVLALDTTGKVRQRIGTTGNRIGQFRMPHMLAFDGDGNLFVAEVDGQRVQKFVRSPRVVRAKSQK